MKKYKVSVIIPTYNRQNLLSKTLDSLCDQSIGLEQYEVIVSDDGSSDCSQKIAESFLGKLNIQYLYQEDLGYRVALARNRGIRIAQGEVVVLIDCGVVVGKCFLSEHIQEFTHTYPDRKKVSIGYTFGYSLNEISSDELDEVTNIDVDKIILHQSEHNIQPDIRDNLYFECNDDLSAIPAPWALFWTANVAFRTEDAIAVGLFDEMFVGWGVEDIELGFRFFLQNYCFILNRKAFGLHLPHKRNNQNNFKSNHINRWKMFEKHRRLDIELFLPSFSSIQFNRDFLRIKEYLNGDHDLFYHRILDSCSFDFYQNFISPSDRTIVWGREHQFFRNNFEDLVFFDCTKTQDDPDSNAIALLGIYSHFPDACFQQGFLLNDSVPEPFLKLQIDEALRIAGNVFGFGESWLKMQLSPDISIDLLIDNGRTTLVKFGRRRKDLL